MKESISPHTILKETDKDRLLRSEIKDLIEETSDDSSQLVEMLACWIKLNKCLNDERRPDQILDLVRQKFEEDPDTDKVKFTSCEYNKEKDDDNG